MAIQVTQMLRKFTFTDTSNDDKEIELPDPSPLMNVNEVQKFYSAQYPSIITGKIIGPEIKLDKVLKVDVAHYSIASDPGTHG